MFLLLFPPSIVFAQSLESIRETGKNGIEVISDVCVFDNNNHAGFTALESYNGCLYLAFREGKGHVANTLEENGRIIVLKKGVTNGLKIKFIPLMVGI